MSLSTLTITHGDDGVEIRNADGKGISVSRDRLPSFAKWLRSIPTELPDEGADASAYGMVAWERNPRAYASVEDDGIYVHIGDHLHPEPEECHALADCLVAEFTLPEPEVADGLGSLLHGERRRDG